MKAMQIKMSESALSPTKVDRIARAENNTARMDDLRAERMAYSQEKAMCDQILFELKDLIDEDLYDSESAQTTSDQLNTNLHSQPPKSDLV